MFADEAGNFDFSPRRDASRYFILCTVTADHCEIGDALLKLRRELGWKGLHLDRVFHASEDPQAIRDEVFTLLADMDSHRVAFWPADSDPCLQVADYCTWAIQRYWERGDDRSRVLIRSKLRTEKDIWQIGRDYFY